jgi:hypothetical protein
MKLRPINSGLHKPKFCSKYNNVSARPFTAAENAHNESYKIQRSIYVQRWQHEEVCMCGIVYAVFAAKLLKSHSRVY